jgi:hypothetical protein
LLKGTTEKVIKVMMALNFIYNKNFVLMHKHVAFEH